MQNFINKLADSLNKAVSEIFDARLVKFEQIENGFYCDYDMSEPLNPRKLDMIAERLNVEEHGHAYELSGFSGVYLDGDSANKMLQRIYVAAFESEKEFRAYKQKKEEAAERDHKKTGTRLGLFSSSEEIGAGLILWHPKGAMIRYLLERFGQQAHILNGYQWVYTPHIGKAKLWETSGHLDFYKESMYNSIKIDEDEYYLKPMNCPFHINIYNSEMRSYRDLPIRMAEYGTVYRYELSGTLHGMTRVRGFTQDDAHIFCMPEQIEDEVSEALKFSLYVLRAFGLNDFKAYISTRPEKKFIGTDENWDMATGILKKAVEASGLDYSIDEGGGAFYGPKIDIKLNDSLGREQQCSTIQFDFNLPERFNISYTGSDGKSHTPFMVHRALFGSIERFTALLIEHYNCDFPLWFAPTQFAIVPVRNSNNEYCARLEKTLKSRGLRVAADYGDTHMREKIKRFEKERIPFILVAGDRDETSGGFSVRGRKGGNLGFMTIEDLEREINEDLTMGIPRSL